jgi:hypothetical protein
MLNSSIENWLPAWQQLLFSQMPFLPPYQHIHTGSEAHPAFYSMRKTDAFPRVKGDLNVKLTTHLHTAA